MCRLPTRYPFVGLTLANTTMCSDVLRKVQSANSVY
ncbi:hypothetical protein AHF37_07953 [Paragonimus kellicotti]|nr:hypothetical protein AHF37_07953 [Paragonimus kellicotti]